MKNQFGTHCHVAAESAPRQRVSATWRALVGWSTHSQRAQSAAARGLRYRVGMAIGGAWGHLRWSVEAGPTAT